MPLRLQIDDARRRLYTRAEGLVTCDEMRAHIHTDLSPEAASYGELIDCSGATTNITVDDIRQLAKERRWVGEKQRKPGAVAVVATDNLFFGMLRMFDVLTEVVRPIRVFRNGPEALEWLEEVEASSERT